MKVRITDSKSLAALTPHELTAYLHSTGWALKGFYAGKATVWEKQDEVLQVPREQRFADYVSRVSEIVETLAAVEERSQLDIYRDLSVATADVIRVRVASPLSNDGSVGLGAGVILIQSTQEMLQAAARATVSSRPAYRSRLPSEAESFLKQARLGQTEHGSYVVTVVCPVAPEFRRQQPGDEFPIPFERQVTTKLASGLDETIRAANMASVINDPQPFLDAVPQGVSANLCDAVAAMRELTEQGQIEIAFSWSRSRTPPKLRTSRIVVPRELISVMRGAGAVLRERTWDGDLEVEGVVVALKRDNPEAVGEVTVKTPWENHWRKVNLWLKPEAYDQATRAHQTGQNIYAHGVIERQGRSFVMANVLAFGTQPDEPA